MCFLQKKVFFSRKCFVNHKPSFPRRASETCGPYDKSYSPGQAKRPGPKLPTRPTTPTLQQDHHHHLICHRGETTRVQGRSQGGETTTYRAVSSKRFGFSWTTTQAGPVDHSCANSSSPSPSCSPTRQQQPDYLTHGGTDDIPKTLTPRHSPSQPHPRGPAQRPQPEPKRH